MSRYADSSFLVSCYIADANTTRARDWLSRTGERLVFTALHALEVRNAFKLGIFRGLFSAAEAAAAQANLEKDLRSGRLVKTPVSLAGGFSNRHTIEHTPYGVCRDAQPRHPSRGRRESAARLRVGLVRRAPKNAGCSDWLEGGTVAIGDPNQEKQSRRCRRLALEPLIDLEDVTSTVLDRAGSVPRFPSCDPFHFTPYSSNR